MYNQMTDVCICQLRLSGNYVRTSLLSNFQASLLGKIYSTSAQFSADYALAMGLGTASVTVLVKGAHSVSQPAYLLDINRKTKDGGHAQAPEAEQRGGGGGGWKRLHSSSYLAFCLVLTEKPRIVAIRTLRSFSSSESASVRSLSLCS